MNQQSVLELTQPDLNSEELQLVGIFDAKTLGCKILFRYDPSFDRPFTITFSYPKPHSITKNRTDPYPTYDLAKDEFTLLHEQEIQAQQVPVGDGEEAGVNPEYDNKSTEELEIMLEDKRQQLEYFDASIQDGNSEDLENDRQLAQDLRKEIEDLEETIKNKILASKGAERATKKDLGEKEPEQDPGQDEDMDLSI